MSSKEILFVDPDHNFTDFCEPLFLMNGYSVTTLHSGGELEQHLEKQTPDLLLLEPALPDCDGLALCRRSRLKYSGPIIMLSVHSGHYDQMIGRYSGANVYINKPIEPNVLIASISQAIQYGTTSSPAAPDALLTCCNNKIEVFTSQQTVWVQGSYTELSKANYNVMELLARNKGKVVSWEALSQAMLAKPLAGNEQTVRANMARIVKLMMATSGDDGCLEEVADEGYVMAQ